MRSDDDRDEKKSAGPAREPSPAGQSLTPWSADWASAIRAYVHEDWFTTGLAEYLEAQADAAEAARPAPCLDCGRLFPRHDLWVHRSLYDVAYCDACYYRRFGRRPA